MCSFLMEPHIFLFYFILLYTHRFSICLVSPTLTLFVVFMFPRDILLLSLFIHFSQLTD